jgi:hypothetical protein
MRHLFILSTAELLLAEEPAVTEPPMLLASHIIE